MVLTLLYSSEKGNAQSFSVNGMYDQLTTQMTKSYQNIFKLVILVKLEIYKAQPTRLALWAKLKCGPNVSPLCIIYDVNALPSVSH